MLDLINSYSGLSLYEIKSKLKWTTGKTDGVKKRLLRKKKIFIKVVERSGRRVELVYPYDQRPSSIIQVSEKELEIGNPLWDNEASIYALDSYTIGVAGKTIPEWSEISCFEKTIPLDHRDGNVLFEIPEEFRRFYQLDQNHSVVTINSNNLLITISGRIIDFIPEL